MTPEQAIREDMRRLYPLADIKVRHVNMNYYEASTADVSHAYLMIGSQAVRQN